MKIKGFQKTSLIDYPGNICSIIFISKCNLRCGYCYNPELVNDQGEEISQKYILEYLEQRKKLIDGLCITGGEPTLHKELINFITKVKELGLKVKLDTNGLNSEMLKDLIKKKLIDFVSMDIKNVFEKYKKTTNSNVKCYKIKESIKIIKESGINHEFRTTVLPRLHKEEDLLKIAQEYLTGAKKYVLQQFFPAEKMIDKNFSKEKVYRKKELEKIKNKCSKYVKTEIRNI